MIYAVIMTFFVRVISGAGTNFPQKALKTPWKTKGNRRKYPIEYTSSKISVGSSDLWGFPRDFLGIQRGVFLGFLMVDIKSRPSPIVS